MIVPMKRLTLVAMKSEQEPIMAALQEIAAVHIIPPDQADPDGSAQLARWEEQVRRIEDAHKLLKRYGEKTKMAPPPDCRREELMEHLERSEELCGQAEALDAELSRLRGERDKCRAFIDQLAPFALLETPVEAIHPTRSARFFAGLTDSRGLELLCALPEELHTAVGLDVFQSERGVAVLAACHAADAEAFGRALKDLPWQDYSFPQGITGTPGANIQAKERQIAQLEERMEKVRVELAQLAQHRKELEMAYDAANIELDREAGKQELALTDSAFFLSGWVREDDQELVKNTVEAVTQACYLEFAEPQEGDEPPSALKNSRLVTPFEAVTNMYSRPAYSGIDATALMTPFYLLFFGMMLADTGYGLLLFIGGLLYQKLLRPRGTMGQLAAVITQCGLSTAVLGLLMGSFFGIEWPDLLGAGSPFPLIAPLDNIMTMIILCCGLGLAHMMFGIAIKAYMCFRDGDIMAGIFDHISWILLVMGLVGVLASGYVAAPWVKTACLISTGLGGGMILLFAGRTKKNVFLRIGGGLGALYNITSYLGDTLSYVRILALGLVGGAMGMVFNLIAGMLYSGLASKGVFGAILGFLLAAAVACAMHAFSLFINTLGTYVHCARLQYVEFFGKFYDANGLEFKPLGYRSKYVNIKK